MKYNVIAAVVERNGKYLCMQRCRSHYLYISEHWEFPGGKRREGESDHPLQRWRGRLQAAGALGLPLAAEA